MNLALLLACTEPKGSPPDDGAPLDDTATTDTGATAPAAEWCDAVAAGASDPGDPILALSHLHASVRFFRPSKDWIAADQALVDAIGGETWDPVAALDTYGPAVGGCVLDADPTPLGDTLVTGDSTLVVVHPGGVPPEIPSDATAVALDLRGLPAGTETAAAIDMALATILVGDADLGAQKVRTFTGFPSTQDDGVYSASTAEIPWVVHGTATAERALFVLTDRALAPEAARAAGALRMAGLAAIAGSPVWAGAAEAEWTAVGDRGLAWPSRTMLTPDGDPWPDVIPADLAEADSLPADLPDLSPVTGHVDRDTMSRTWKGATDTPLSDLDRGAARAMLMVAHGEVDRFWPYFDVVGREHDDALLAGLTEVDALAEGDRVGVTHALGRFVHSLHDGHAFFGDWYGTDYVDSYLALQIERIDGEPVVRSSGYDDVLPGDTIVEIDGVPADEWYAESMARHSAATDGYLFEVSGREWWEGVASADIVVRDLDGAERSVTLDGMPFADEQALVPWGGTLRPSGFLDDLGAPSIYFLNLNEAVTTADDQWEAALDDASGAAGLVVDMRDYPAVNHYAVASALRTGDFSSPTFRTPTWTGPDVSGWDESSYALTGTGRFAGPIVLLVSNKTVSAAENFSMMLWDDPNIAVIGETSAGTNGNITGGYLPGGYYMDFTGMHVLNPDGSELHGVGIPLDEEVVPTAEDFADGRDPELDAAIAWFAR